MEQMTSEQAIAFGETGAWEKLTLRERAELQIEQDYLCMPFDKFHEAIEKTLGRPVYTHEFALNREGLRKELAGTGPALTMEESIRMLEEKTGKPVIILKKE